jgi:hypothetical protein
MAADKIQLRFGNLNKSVIRLLTKAVEENAPVDLMPVFEGIVGTYTNKRNAITEHELKKHRNGESPQLNVF